MNLRRDQMKAVRAHQIGGPEVLQYEDVTDPEPAPGEALLQVKAVGVNFTDVASRRGSNPSPGRRDGKPPGW